jgi:hypothetical protein
MFSSAHSNTNVEELIRNERFLKNNDITRVGRLDVSSDHLHIDSDNPFLDRIVYKDTRDDAFWLELKSKVTSYLRDNDEAMHYTVREGIAYVIYYLVIYIWRILLIWPHIMASRNVIR